MKIKQLKNVPSALFRYFILIGLSFLILYPIFVTVMISLMQTSDFTNSDCPVCSAEDADLSACKGTEQATPLMAAAADDGTISGNVTWENRNITTPVTVKGDTTITLKGENSIYQPATETTDKYDIDDDGTKDTVYEISNAGQLYWFAELVNGTLDGVEQNTLANAILTANITVNENLLDSLQYDEENNVSNGSDFITWTPIADWMGNRLQIGWEIVQHSIQERLTEIIKP